MAKKAAQSKPRPVEKLRAYPVQAAIWRNESDNGVFHSVTFSRVYKDGQGEYRDGDSYSGTQLLQLAHLAPKAYDRAEALTRKAREAANDGQPKTAGDDLEEEIPF
jgi:hypothetical protein